ncbi:MAG: uracil-DNA glycosylase [Microthrixaceae bacterium]
MLAESSSADGEAALVRRAKGKAGDQDVLAGDVPSGRRDSWDLLTSEIVACRACPRLVEWREAVARSPRREFEGETYWAKPVPGFGDPSARVVLVGLAPAAHGANRTGRMFTGDRSGDFLFAALHRAGYANQPSSRSRNDGLALTDAYIVSPVKCAPPDNRPTVTERERCRPFLRRELALLERATVFVVLGGYGYQVLAGELGLRPRPRFGHGVEAPLGDGRTVLCSYHVSQHNTFTGRLTTDMLDEVLGRARALAEAGP